MYTVYVHVYQRSLTYQAVTVAGWSLRYLLSNLHFLYLTGSPLQVSRKQWYIKYTQTNSSRVHATLPLFALLHLSITISTPFHSHTLTTHTPPTPHTHTLPLPTHTLPFPTLIILLHTLTPSHSTHSPSHSTNHTLYNTLTLHTVPLPLVSTSLSPSPSSDPPAVTPSLLTPSHSTHCITAESIARMNFVTSAGERCMTASW